MKGLQRQYINPTSNRKGKLPDLSEPGAYSMTAQPQWEQPGAWDNQQHGWDGGMSYVNYAGQYAEMPRRLCMIEEARPANDDDGHSEFSAPGNI